MADHALVPVFDPARPDRPCPTSIDYADQARWRKAASSFGTSHRIPYKGKNGRCIELTMATLRQFYTDAYTHWIAAEQLFLAAGVTPMRAGAAFAFWFCLNSPELLLPVQIVHGLLSCVRTAGFTCLILLTYQPISNVPLGVTVMDASQFMVYADFAAVPTAGGSLQPHIITWLADYVRLRACATCSATCATFIDADIIWVREFPFATISMPRPREQGHGRSHQHVDS